MTICHPPRTEPKSTIRTVVLTLSILMIAACGGSSTDESDGDASETTTSAEVTTTSAEPEDEADETTTSAEATTTSAPEDAANTPQTGTTGFEVEVWADNWFALYANGELIGEDSVPITTERSFNSETFTFEASYPLTIAIEAKDFKENDTGLEYIGEPNQQMGDGGIIAQITDTNTSEIVAVTDGTWSALVIHQAPVNPECAKDADPSSTCRSEIIDAPANWTAVGFDDSSWGTATEWTEADVSPKDGYDQISWDTSAELIWGPDLEIDNTILLRSSVGATATESAQGSETQDSDDDTDDLADDSSASPSSGTMEITSPAVADGALLAEFACEPKDNGMEASIPLAWSGVPAEATSLAITMHHFPNADDAARANSYLTLWDIDPSVSEIAHGQAGEGDWFQGSNKDGTAISYTSPCSPNNNGSHEYTITLYALSDTPPTLPQQDSLTIDWEVLVESLESVTVIDSVTLTFNA
ncbi:MAG: YbhB/YbcL family Raf kinase inhibitor-like protein [Actinomycetia bacterium]|nr:YbhB/YbcL family Raf kinase inhibitor-like protein [Actinomycetes bacterium]MCP4960457.1 YbhB/YbcL family Raf kinase inhibitor-like protein [Actinomycetes bacterium]